MWCCVSSLLLTPQANTKQINLQVLKKKTHNAHNMHAYYYTFKNMHKRVLGDAGRKTEVQL